MASDAISEGSKMADEPAHPARGLRVAWGSTDDTPVVFANQVSVVQPGNGEVFLTFGTLAPPAFFDPDQLPDVLYVKPILRIAMLPRSYRAMVETLKQSLEDFDESARTRDDKEELP